MENFIGKSLGRYHVLEQLGEGGMATVYKAYDTNLDREVAIKIIRRETFPPQQSEQLLKRFEREAKALAKLVQPNIVAVIDYGSQDNNPYLVMNYLPGGTLKQKLGKPMPWPEAVHLLLPIARALQFAHAQGIIHRDVKPSNILLTEGGDPMLTDFGIAKILEAGEETQLTAAGVGVGTPDYMAPEQWTGTVSPQTDIYSLGVVLYQMVTGRLPFNADTPAAVLIKHVRDPLPRPKSFVPDLPDAVEQLLIKALAKEPENRFQDMGSFANALYQLTKTEPTVRPPVSEQAESFNRTLVSSRVPAGPGVVPGARTPPAAAGKRTWLIGLAVGVPVLVLACITIGLFNLLGHPGKQTVALQPSPTASTAALNIPSPSPLPSPIPPPVGIKVGIVINTNGLDDHSINAVSWQGVQEAISKLGISGKYLESSQQSDYDRNIQQLIAEKDDLIVTVGSEEGVITATAAKANPNQKFMIIDYSYPDCSGTMIEGSDCGSSTDLPNVRGTYFKTDQAAFLAGYLAAGMTKTGKIGTFGGMNIPSVTLYMKGYQAGALYYNQVHSANVQVLGWDNRTQTGLFTGDFTSTDDGHSFAQQLVEKTGADIIFPVDGNGGVGSAAYCETSKKCLIIGVDQDWFVSANEYHDIELTSVEKAVDVAVFDTVQDVQNGKFTSGRDNFTLANDGVNLASYHDFGSRVPDALKAEILTTRQALIDGTITVDDSLQGK